ncbi:MAG: glutamate-1-semialdehyde 2,1-aminomutase [Planctomycetota bacterium]
MKFDLSRQLQQRVHEVIPGGCHTYAKGDDQYPYLAPGFIDHGKGCHVWDVDGNEFIEYGIGCRAVTLGHAFEPVLQRVRVELEKGCSFGRPAKIELECADELIGMIDGAEMCKFAKDGSTVTTAALKIARAATGRDRIALCGDHPFFSIHDWFIGTTAMDAGIPKAIQELSLTFRYNDPESLEFLFKKYPGEIACVILEPAKYEDPRDHFLHRVQELCEQHGAVFVLDEMITGFRYHQGGAQKLYDIQPDLSTFGKGLANGFSLSALVGKRQLMEICGLYHDQPRVFALSTTHGAETHALAAAIGTMQFYQQQPVIETMDKRGTQLAAGIRQEIDRAGVKGFVDIVGKPCNLIFTTCDTDGKPSQGFRCVLMQELIRRGVLGPSLAISYSHSQEDVRKTVQAFAGALDVYRQALDKGYESFLVGRPTQTVYQFRNGDAFGKAQDLSGSFTGCR